MTTQKIEIFRKGVKLLAGIGSGIFVGLNVIPHVFPRATIDTVHALPARMFQHMNPRYTKILDETCNLMNIDPSKIELTHSRGLNTLSAGCLTFPKNSVIVLPRNALYTHPDHLDHSGISFNDNTRVDWNSNVGKALKEVLILTDNEIRFLIGHELTHISDYHFIASTVQSVGSFYGFYKLGTVLSKIPKQMSFGTLAFITISVWLMGIPFYYVTKQPLSHYLEYMADEKSAMLDPNYCNGGISYTRKKLKLNRILRATTENGEECYSKMGNSTLVQDNLTHPKRTERLRKLKEIKDTYYSCDKVLPDVQ